MYGSLAVMLYKKEPYARFVVIGYSVFLGFSLLYDLPVQYGMVDVGITEWILKIGAFLEMIVFLYAISYRHKGAVIDREKMNERLKKEIKSKQLIAQENNQVKIKLEEKQLKSKTVYTNFANAYQLTPRESEIGELLLKGYSNKKISEDLNLKSTTIKFHITNIFVKLDITRRIEFLNLFLKFKNTNNL
jgi:DNA-binding CsgD family transcriptional regulator